MKRGAKLVLGLISLFLGIVLICGYAYVKSVEYVNGPQITIISPRDGQSFNDSPIVISGTAKNIAYISLNDSQIFIDAQGNFNQKLLLLPGYNIFSIKAQDRFGKKVEKTLELIYKVPAEESVASSTLIIN